MAQVPLYATCREKACFRSAASFAAAMSPRCAALHMGLSVTACHRFGQGCRMFGGERMVLLGSACVLGQAVRCSAEGIISHVGG